MFSLVACLHVAPLVATKSEPRQQGREPRRFPGLGGPWEELAASALRVGHHQFSPVQLQEPYHCEWRGTEDASRKPTGPFRRGALGVGA